MKRELSTEQALGIFRHVLTFVGGILVVKGIASESVVMDISGAALSLWGVIASFINKVKGAVADPQGTGTGV